MMHDFLYPNGITYFIVKLLVLCLAVFIWYLATAAPVA